MAHGGEKVNSIHRRCFFVCVLVVLLTAAATYAQDWPLPAATPNTDVPCTGCFNGKDGLKTIGYPPTLRFVGRFTDSEATKEYQFYYRTARARGVTFLESSDPTKSRIYMMVGSGVGAYNTDTFFSRLAAHETLYPASAIPTRPSPNYRSPFSELFLWWDRWFYAEQSDGAWILGGGDGQDRLYGIDADDRGYVYMAYSTYGWGIARDDFGTGADRMPSVFQHLGEASDVTPISIVLSKVDSEYYVVVSSGNDKAQVWRVTRPANPEKMSDLPARAFNSFAKDTAGSRIATVDGNGRLQILTNSAFVNGGAPLVSRVLSGGQYKAVTTDGTNFYALSSISGSSYVSVINGSTYAETQFPILNTSGGPASFSTPGGIRAGAGFLAVWGIEDAAGGWNLHLYKIGNGSTLADVPLDNYFAKYYSGGSPAGYAHPSFSAFMDVAPYKRGAKTYLILESFGLGDLYEIKAGDSLAARLTSTPTAFYGDRQTFTSTTGSNNPMAVTWDFGDGTQGSTIAGSPTITHQFGGATAADLPLTRRVTATSQTDSSLTDAITVTLAKPQAAFKVAATGYLFKLPDASSAAQIVTGDAFADISDGANEGHYTQWTLDQATTKTQPSAAFAVGACGNHTLKFVAHYGPYDTNTFAANSDAQFAIDSVVYASRPYAIAVQPPPASSIQTSPDTAVFTSTIRTSQLPADLPGGLNTACTYQWDLIDGGNVNRQQLKASATLGTIPTFPVARNKFNSPGMKVLLTVTVTPDKVSAACNAAGLAAQSVATGALNGPDPTIVKTGCDHVGDPCKFTVTSAGAQTGWSYDWSVGGPAPCAHCGALADYSPTLTTIGTYTATLVVTNGIGSATVQSAPFSVGQATCPAPQQANSAIGFSGPTSGCFSTLDKCAVGEAISFRVSAFGWSLADCNTYQWNFGDGATSNLPQPTHAYSSSGAFNVTLLLTGGVNTASLVTTVTTGSPPPPPPPPPPPGGGTCTAQTSQSAYVGFIGPTSGCTSSFGTCNPSESILFTLYPQGYNFACATTTFQWTFSDGGSGSGQSFSHAFPSPGAYSASCTASNNGGQQTYSLSLQVGTTQPKTCGTMTQSNTKLTYSGPNCTDAGGDCKPADTVQFSAVSNGSPGYDFTCATHNYAWTFGDGGTSILANPTHTYSSSGKWPAKVTITQGSQNIQLSHDVSVNGSSGGFGVCPTMYPDSNVYIRYSGPTSQCYAADTACKVGEVVAFRAASFLYDFGCGSHTYTWDFGDGGHSTEQTPSHPYTTDGTYKVTLHLTNPTQPVDLTATVKVGSGVSVPLVPPRHRSSRH